MGFERKSKPPTHNQQNSNRFIIQKSAIQIAKEQVENAIGSPKTKSVNNRTVHITEKGESLWTVSQTYYKFNKDLIGLSWGDYWTKVLEWNKGGNYGMIGGKMFLSSPVESSEKPTVFSISEDIAREIIKRHNGAQRAKNAKDGLITTEEERKKMTSLNGAMNFIGERVLEIINDQAVIDKYAPDLGAFFTNMSETMSNDELSGLQEVRHEVRGEVQSYGQGMAMMNIFSPDNVGTILFMFMGSGGTSKTLREQGYKFLLSKTTDQAAKNLLSRMKIAFKAAQKRSNIFIKNKHLNVGSGNYAKFKTADISIARKWVQEGLRSKNAVFKANPNLAETFRVEVNMGRVIGTKGEKIIRIIVGNDGKVINAFPIK